LKGRWIDYSRIVKSENGKAYLPSESRIELCVEIDDPVILMVPLCCTFELEDSITGNKDENRCLFIDGFAKLARLKQGFTRSRFI
jgi:hypothetical protein